MTGSERARGDVSGAVPARSRLHVRARTLRTLARRGWHAALARARRWFAPTHAADVLHVFVARVDSDVHLGVRRRIGVDFSEISASDVAEQPLVYSSSRINAVNCVAGGGRCYAGIAEGRVVFRMWTLALDEAASQRLAPGEPGRGLFIHDAWTHPDFRGEGVYPAALAWVASGHVGRSDFLVLTTTGVNRAAIRAARKAGYRQVASSLPETAKVGERAAMNQVAGQDSARHGAIDSLALDPGSAVSAVRPRALLDIIREVLNIRGSACIVGTGLSMHPTLREGEILALERCDTTPRVGAIVLFEGRGGPVVHRVVASAAASVLTRGDAALLPDGWSPLSRVIGTIVAKAPRRESVDEAPGFALIADRALDRTTPGITALTFTTRFGLRATARYLRTMAHLMARRALLRCSRWVRIERWMGKQASATAPCRVGRLGNRE